MRNGPVVALALVLVLAPASMSIAAATVGATDATAPPSGYVALPDSSVTVDSGLPTTVTESELEGSVYASDHDSTTELRLTDRETADSLLGPDTEVVGGSDVAIVVSDEVAHEGRKLAIDATLVSEAIGYLPDVIHGAHEDGEKWTREATYRDGYIILSFPEFSSNSVTFGGTVNVSATGYDGGSTTYTVNDLASVSDVSANVTGRIGTEWDNSTATVSAGGSRSVALAGNREPSGPASGEPQIVVEGLEGETNSRYFGVELQGGSETQTITGYNANADLHQVCVEADNSDGNSGAGFEIYVEGTKVDSVLVNSGNTKTVCPSISQSTDTNGEVDVKINSTDNIDSITINDVSASVAAPDNVEVTASTGESALLGDFTIGETKSAGLNLSTATDSLSLSADHGRAQITLEVKERAAPVDPGLAINGNATQYTGVLSDGETVTLSPDASAIAEGDNTVTIETNPPNDDSPGGRVELVFTHDMQSTQSVDYDAEKFSERYNISKTYASDREGATLTIPFAGEVHSIRNVEIRTNGGSWTTVESADYSLSNTTLTVDIGAVSSGTTVEVRATGSRIQVTNGAVTVTNPTVMGSRLDSEIQLDEWHNDSSIVLPTEGEQRVAYAYQESWTDPKDSMVVDGNTRSLKLPNANNGSSAVVSTIPVTVSTDGDVKIRVTDPTQVEPSFRVSAARSGGDSVEFTYLNAEDGGEYVLWSVTAGERRDKGTAGSPVTLTDDDSDETLEFRQVESFGSTGGVGGTPPKEPSDNVLNSVPVVAATTLALVLVALAIVATFGGRSVAIPFTGASLRIPGGSRTSYILVAVVVLVVFEVTTQAVSSTVADLIATVVLAFRPALQPVVTIGGFVAVGLVAYLIYQRFTGSEQRPIVIRGDGGGD